MTKKFFSLFFCCLLIVTLTSAASVSYKPEAIDESNGVSDLSSVDKLFSLRIMTGTPGSDGEIEILEEENLTRQEAIVLLLRATGHGDEIKSGSFGSPFTDLSDWAAGAVGYAYELGITDGISDTLFGSEDPVTIRELIIFALRALGYGSEADYENACELALTLGLIEDLPENPDEYITRGRASDLYVNMLTVPFNDSEITPVQLLIDTGYVTSEEALSAGFSISVSPDTVTAEEALTMYADCILSISALNTDGEEISVCYGALVDEGIGVTSLSGLEGAAALRVTTSSGESTEAENILYYDEDLDIVYFSLTGSIADYPGVANGEIADGSAAYILSSYASVGLKSEDGIFAVFEAGLPVVSSTGDFIGISASGGLAGNPEFTETQITVAELGELLWPEAFLPSYPRGIDPTKPMVAITYDDGPHETYTGELLDLLEEYGVVATFFEVGSRLETMHQFLIRMEELGCEVGNHTYSHKNLTRLTSQGIYDEVENTNAIIREVLGHDATLVRVPGGSLNARVRENIDFPIIGWSVDTLDWKSRDAESVINEVTGVEDLDGAIILMHSLYSSTVEASEYLIPWLIENGYQLVTVSELAEYRGYTLESGTAYYSFKPQE